MIGGAIVFEKNMRISYLLDFYGEVLDEHTRTVMDTYYNDDLSLSEVATEVGISRQGVRHVIKKGEEQLLFLEERLGLAEQNEQLQSVAQLLEEIRCKLASDNNTSDASLVKRLDEAIGIILKKTE